MGTLPQGLQTNGMVKMMNNTRIVLGLCLAIFACGDESPAIEVDSGAVLDAASAIDAGSVDAAAVLPHPGFGALTGDCDVLDDELTSGMSGFFRLELDFDRLYTDGDLSMLTQGGQEIIADGNAGGSSVLSEVFAYEALQRCEDALLLKTENEIVYDTQGKITDFLAELDGEKIGVSVTRAVAFPFADPYPLASAQDLLSGKLADVLVSSANVSSGDRWTKQILAVLAYSPAHGDVLLQAYQGLDSSITADTLVVVIVTNGADDFIYCNGLCE